MANAAKDLSTQNCEQRVPPDGGYGWVVLASSAAIGALYVIPGIVGGIIFNHVMLNMSASAAQVTTMITLVTCMFNLTGPFSASYTQRTSCRRGAIIGGLLQFISLFICAWVKSVELLTFTYGCIAGVGISFAINSSIFVINEYFMKRRAVVTGIRMCGSSIGRVAFSPLLQYLMLTYGYTGLMLLSSSFLLHICVCGALLQPVKRHLITVKRDQAEEPLQNSNQQEQNQDDNKEKTAELNANPPEPVTELDVKKKPTILKRIYDGLVGKLNFSLMKNPIFYVFFINNFANGLTYSYSNIFMYPFAVSKGLEPMQAAYVQSGLGVCDIFGRLIITSLMDFPKLGARNINIVSCFMTATMLLALVFTTTYASTMAVACVLGFFGGGQFGGFVALCAKVVGPRNVPTIFGLTQFLQGIILLGFGPLMGKLRDVTGDFQVCYYIFAAFNFLAAAAWLVELCARRWWTRPAKRPDVS